MKLVFLYLSCFSCLFYSCFSRAQTNQNGVPVCVEKLGSVGASAASCSVGNVSDATASYSQTDFQEIALGHVARLVWKNSKTRYTKSQLTDASAAEKKGQDPAAMSGFIGQFIHDSRYDFRISAHKFIVRLTLKI